MSKNSLPELTCLNPVASGLQQVLLGLEGFEGHGLTCLGFWGTPDPREKTPMPMPLGLGDFPLFALQAARGGSARYGSLLICPEGDVKRTMVSSNARCHPPVTNLQKPPNMPSNTDPILKTWSPETLRNKKTQKKNLEP